MYPDVWIHQDTSGYIRIPSGYTPVCVSGLYPDVSGWRSPAHVNMGKESESCIAGRATSLALATSLPRQRVREPSPRPCPHRSAMSEMPVEQNLVETQVVDTVPAEFDGATDGPLCGKCKTIVEPEDMVVKHVSMRPSQKVLRKSCHSVSVMMTRNLVAMPEGWSDLSIDQVQDFYKKMLSYKHDGVLRFNILRTEMKNALISRKVEETRRGFNGEFHPLGYWAKKGYDADLIQQKAEKMDHPVMGTTYRVDVFHVSSDSIEQNVEEAIRSVDKNVKRKKIPKAKASNKKSKGEKKDEAEEPPVPVDPNLIDLVDLESEASSVECLTENGRKLTPTQLAARKKKEEIKQAKEQEKLSKKLTTLASKSLASLQPLQQRLSKTKKNLKIGEVGDLTLENLDKSIGFVDTAIDECLAAMKMVVAGKIVSKEVFGSIENDKDLSSHVKSINEVMKAVGVEKKANATA